MNANDARMPPSEQAMALLRDGRSFFAQGDVERARQCFAAALEIAPHDPAARSGLERCERLLQEEVVGSQAPVGRPAPARSGNAHAENRQPDAEADLSLDEGLDIEPEATVVDPLAAQRVEAELERAREEARHGKGAAKDRAGSPAFRDGRGRGARARQSGSGADPGDRRSADGFAEVDAEATVQVDEALGDPRILHQAPFSPDGSPPPEGFGADGHRPDTGPGQKSRPEPDAIYRPGADGHGFGPADGFGRGPHFGPGDGFGPADGFGRGPGFGPGDGFRPADGFGEGPGSELPSDFPPGPGFGPGSGPDLGAEPAYPLYVAGSPGNYPQVAYDDRVSPLTMARGRQTGLLPLPPPAVHPLPPVGPHGVPAYPQAPTGAVSAYSHYAGPVMPGYAAPPGAMPGGMAMPRTSRFSLGIALAMGLGCTGLGLIVGYLSFRSEGHEKATAPGLTAIPATTAGGSASAGRELDHSAGAVSPPGAGATAELRETRPSYAKATSRGPGEARASIEVRVVRIEHPVVAAAVATSSGEVERVHVKAGGSVTTDQKLYTLREGKGVRAAEVVVSAPAAGRIERRAARGDRVEKGEVLAQLVDPTVWVVLADLTSNEITTAWSCQVSAAEGRNRAPCRLDSVQRLGGQHSRATASVLSDEADWIQGGGQELLLTLTAPTDAIGDAPGPTRLQAAPNPTPEPRPAAKPKSSQAVRSSASRAAKEAPRDTKSTEESGRAEPEKTDTTASEATAGADDTPVSNSNDTPVSNSDQAARGKTPTSSATSP